MLLCRKITHCARKAPKPFLARPFWRDYLLAYVLIGAGCLLLDSGDTRRPPGDLRPLIPGGVVFCCGMAIFLCAFGWSLGQGWTGVFGGLERRRAQRGLCPRCGYDLRADARPLPGMRSGSACPRRAG